MGVDSAWLLKLAHRHCFNWAIHVKKKRPIIFCKSLSLLIPSVCLGNVQLVSETPSCYTFPASSNFPKLTIWQALPLHKAIGQVGGENKPRGYGFSQTLLFPSSLRSYFCHFLFKQPTNKTPWKPSRRDCQKRAPLSQYPNDYHVSLLSMTACFSLCLRVWLVQTAINTFAFWHGRMTLCTN